MCWKRFGKATLFTIVVLHGDSFTHAFNTQGSHPRVFYICIPAHTLVRQNVCSRGSYWFVIFERPYVVWSPHWSIEHVCLSCQLYDIWTWNPRKALRRVTESLIPKPNCKMTYRQIKAKKKKNGRYVTGRLQWCQCRMQASSLGWYLHGQPAPLLLWNMFGRYQLLRLTLRNRVWPHTRRPFCRQSNGSVNAVYTYILSTESGERVLLSKTFLYIKIS